jgi:carboxyl-terminal processing protease
MISTKKYVYTVVLAVVLIAGSFIGGLKLGGRGYVFKTNGFSVTNGNGQPTNVDYSLLWSAMSDLQQNYIDWGSVDQQKVLYGAVNGMVNAVGDPHTEFFDPTDLAAFNSELDGTFSGIGAQVGLAKDGNVEIVSPLPGTPALKAGLKTGDEILKINGTSATGITLDNAVTQIRGPKGTQVVLSIYRPSAQATMSFTITRDTISVPSVTYSVKTDGAKKVEYIDISTFGTDTDTLFAQAAAQAASNNVSGVILDLRGDGGGYLTDAVAVSSYWVTPGQTIVTEQHNAQNAALTKAYPATGGNTLAKIPTIILVDAGTASASEITSGALRDYGFAKLVGVQTYGKGSVQQLFNLQGGSAIKVTIAKWLTPKGVNINGNGLLPDYSVPLTDANTANGADPQLAKALDLLK